jgi:hypothetical protein
VTLPECASCAEWRAVANDLAGALRPYSLWRDQSIKDGRIVVECAVPGEQWSTACAALDRLAAHVFDENHRTTKARAA